MQKRQQGIKTLEADVLVIGAGPAGLTAGLYTARAGKKTIILEGKASSRLSLKYDIENYPGFVSIESRKLRDRFKHHAQHFGAEIIGGDVLDFNLAFDPKMAATRDLLIQAGAVILATGKPMPKGKMIPGEERLIGLGVSYCSTCDGPLYRGKRVAAVGNTEETAEDVLALNEMGCQVIWLTGADEDFFLSEKARQRLPAETLILRPRSLVKEILGEQRVEKLIAVHREIEEEIEVDGVFIFRDVPTAPLLVKAGLNLDHRQCVKTDRLQRTNIDGVFAAGDLTCGGMQVVSAAGEGCVAALEAIKYLRARNRI